MTSLEEIKFPHPSSVAQFGWTHQVNWKEWIGDDNWVPCVSRHTTQMAAEAYAARLRRWPYVRDAQVNPIPQAEGSSDE